MAIKSYKAIVREVEDGDSYWVECAKHDFSFGLYRQLKRHQISNAELAKRLKVSAPYVSKVMRGDENFTIEAMVKIARAAGAKLHLQLADQADAVRWFQITSSKPKTEKTNASAFITAQKALKLAA